MPKLSVSQKIKLKLGLALSGWMLIGLALLLTGCATTSPEPSEPPKIPRPPALTQPLPSVTYSEAWRQKVEDLRRRVTGTQTTSER